MGKILVVVQIALSVLLITVVLLQQKGSGLGSAFGGLGDIYNAKRGLDRTLHLATIVISVLFFLTALASLWF